MEILSMGWKKGKVIELDGLRQVKQLLICFIVEVTYKNDPLPTNLTILLIKYHIQQ